MAGRPVTRYSTVTMSSEPTNVTVAMRMDAMRSDLIRGLVWFVNYAALDPTAVRSTDLDLKGTAMLPHDVELFAHRWLGFSRSIDIEHDGVGRPVDVVESFFNSPAIASPSFPVNSHPMRLDVSRSEEAMTGLRDGTLNSVSLDALTFNRVVRLPVATSRSAPAEEKLPVPTMLSDWASELAHDGYDGVVNVVEVSKGLYVATRSGGRSPVAVSIDGSSIEVLPGSGAWAEIGMVLAQSPTLTMRSVSKLCVDFRPWSEDEVNVIMGLIGLNPAGTVDRLGPLEEEFFAALDTSTLRGFLPHHTVGPGGVLMNSPAAVRRALSQLHTVPESMRDGARRHLEQHLAEVS